MNDTAEDKEIAELQILVERRRAELGIPEPKPISDLMEKYKQNLVDTPASLAREAARERQVKESEEWERQNRIAGFVNGTRNSLGKYRHATLDGYDVYAGKIQQAVKDRVSRMQDEIATVLARKLNVVFWGTLGTGKDHLAACLLASAAHECVTARMLSGRVYYAECAAAFSVESTQLEVYQRWTQPQIVCLSDPVFEAGWKPQWGEYLNNLIRLRYDDGKATWATVNARDEQHAAEMFGFDVWDRLAENSVMIEMKWPSYRTRNKQSEF